MLYGCETWTINQQMMKRLEAENVILTGKIEGKRARGRPRETFFKKFDEKVGMIQYICRDSPEIDGSEHS